MSNKREIALLLGKIMKKCGLSNLNKIPTSSKRSITNTIMRGQDMNRNIAADNHLLSKIFLIFLIRLESNKFINNNSSLILNNNTKHPCFNSKHKSHN
jgi:hypothetical protein